MRALMPPEWAPQELLWVGFPHDQSEWGSAFAEAQVQIAAFASAVAETGQEVRLIVRSDANAERARSLASAAVKIEPQIYGDIWLRDTGPLIAEREGKRVAQCFLFNGWGGKYMMAGDETIGCDLARSVDLQPEQQDWVLEGGAIDGDGAGLFVTTEQCLLNPNRNPDLSRGDIAARLGESLGAEDIVWLGDGLANDHTDGHVDNLARFVAPRTLLLPEASGVDDPNRVVYEDARARAERFAGEAAQPLTLHSIPSPGSFMQGGALAPASYMNFVITNHAVVVPLYGTSYDEGALEVLGALFPGREIIGLPATAVLAGGGGFHCASQQLPLLSD